MSKVKTRFRQCELKRTPTLGSGLLSTVCYIPDDLAKVGKFIEIKDAKSWETWQVASTASESISNERAKKLDKRSHQRWGSLAEPE
jgi:hypothetical protein